MRRARRVPETAALTLLALLITFVAGCGQGSRGSGDDLLRGLTLEQKVGQLFLVGFEGTSLTPELERWFRSIHPGGVILFARNIADEAQLAQLVRDLQDLARADAGRPLLVAVDQEGGEVARISWLHDDTSQAEMSGPEQAYQAALARARGLRGLGINLNLAPVMDMGMPGDFLSRYGRAFTGTPQQVGELGRAVICGQKDGGILSAAKHFPGYGGIDCDPENDRLASLPSLPHIAQFQEAATADPEFVMTASVVYPQLDPDLPLTLSPAGVAFLRESVPGGYLVLSDDLATPVLKQAYTLRGAVVQAFRANVDMLLVCGHQAGDTQAAYEALLEAVRSGGVSREDIDSRVSRVLLLKQRLDY